MTDKQSLEQQLETQDFYKKVFPGIFKSGKRKDALETWENAKQRGVSDSVLLREASNGSFMYKVYAFSVKGDIEKEMIETLKSKVNEFDVNQIRYEAVSVPGYFAVYDKDGKFFQDDYQIMRLYQEDLGIYIVIVSETEKDELDCPYVLYTFNPDGSLWFWCIARKYIQ